MPLTNVGRNQIAAQIIGESVTPFNAANAYIAVGQGALAFDALNTTLQSELGRKPMDATFPTRTVNTLTLRSTFGTADANGAWNEWGILNAAANGLLLSRRVEVLGTKPSTQSWQFTVTLTINAA